MSEKSRVTAVIQEGYVVTAETRGHRVHTDEPNDLGGTDTSMTPTELFLSALAGCKLTTLRMVANRKMWDTEGLSIELELDEDQEIPVIHQTITFPEHLTEEQRQKLTDISHKCPVAKLITGPLRITDTRL